MNPFEPPHTSESASPAPASFAIRTSLGLAAGGLAAIASSIALAVSEAANERTPGILSGVLLLLGAITHLVGAAVSFAAVPGRRATGLWANAIPLLLLLASLAAAAWLLEWPRSAVRHSAA
jgi:hypothetical protein